MPVLKLFRDIIMLPIKIKRYFYFWGRHNYNHLVLVKEMIRAKERETKF